jgi:prevent-host-death family protein
MNQINESEAQKNLYKLLDAVEKGETFTVTRHGKKVALMEPYKDRE